MPHSHLYIELSRMIHARWFSRKRAVRRPNNSREAGADLGFSNRVAQTIMFLPPPPQDPVIAIKLVQKKNHIEGAQWNASPPKKEQNMDPVIATKQVRIQDLQIEGAQMIMCSQRTLRVQTANLKVADGRDRGHLGPQEALEFMYRCSLMLSEHYFEAFWYKNMVKKT